MKNELLTVKDVYGRTCHIAKRDYENPNRTQLVFYTILGNKFCDTQRGIQDFKRGGCISIHRENIAEVIL